MSIMNIISLLSPEQPYLEFSKALNALHRNFEASFHANMVFQTALVAASQRQQALLIDFLAAAEKVAQTAPTGRGCSVPSAWPADAMGDLIDNAIAHVREMGRLVTDAQVDALRALKAQLLDAEAAVGRENGTLNVTAIRLDETREHAAQQMAEAERGYDRLAG